MNAALIDAWIAWLAGGNIASSTLRIRRCLIEHFARERDLQAATGLDVQGFLAGLPGGPWSRQGYLATLRGFYHWATLTGAVREDPTRLVHSIRTPPGVPKPVPESVLARALALADDETRFMLLLGAYAGLRRAEIAALHSDDVGADHLTITGKGGKTRVIPIHPRLRPYLDFTGWAFPSDRKPGDHVHPETVNNRVRDALGDPWTPHTLRHRFATATYRATRDIRAVQELLGHTSPATTARYVQADDDAKRAAVLAVA